MPATPADSSPEAASVQATVRTALRTWRNSGEVLLSPLASWLLVRQQLEATDADDPLAIRSAASAVLENGLKQLATHAVREAEILRARYQAGLTAEEVAAQFNLTRDIVNHIVSSAAEHLSEILVQQEQIARQTQVQSLEARLPPAQYRQLFGLAQIQTQLVEQLLKPAPPWVSSIVGIGGIGKTALADAVTRQTIHKLHFEQVIWLRLASYQTTEPNLTFETFTTQLLGALLPEAQASVSAEQRLAQIRLILKARPHLIVIDNLETEADTVYLLDHLNNLAVPSKFLLTTRTRLPAGASVFSLSLDELPPAAAFELLRHQAAVIGLEEIAQAQDDRLATIYQVVGGNPLALKLVIGLASVQSLPQILADLINNPTGEIDDLYRRIFWKAWHALSPQAQALLQAMPLVAAPGALPAQLLAISRLSEKQLNEAIAELATRSLIEVRGTVWERRYGIHHLTETFLQTDINHWSDVKAQ